jgi:heterodisulfide reductase subunit A-like polyferredoxin
MSVSKDHKIGAVLVLGAGIAGMQAALDLADSGYKVYLVEEGTSIGGRMAQLDKTFPTNDCSMCTLSPRLIEIDKHLNIELITNAELEKLEGEAGRFRASVIQHPRYIDLDKCTACGDCSQVCPVERLNKYDMELVNRKAIYISYPQAIPASFAIEKLDKAPCSMACPANLNIQGYIAMVKMGKYKEAIEIIMNDLPFPGVLGRVCPHKCEESCRRLELDQAISIRELKRVAADHVQLEQIPVPEIESKDKRIVIIGSGPAGLTASYFLALDGYKVIVYESMPKAGGMMRYGIPEHRLPSSVLDAEIENLKRYGIEINTEMAIGKDMTVEDLRKHGADAIFLAIGAWKSLKLGMSGEETKGVSDVTSFLREVRLGKVKKLEGKVVVVGGGHSALDGARVALRLGAKEVNIIYRRSKTEMLAEPEEIEEAEKEGVKIHFLTAPLKISAEGNKVSGIECIRTRLTEPDTTGRRKPIPVEGSEFFIEADNIIPAIGQEPDFSFLGKEHGLEISKWNLLVVNPETLQTNIPDIFAGGDVITGPATVIEAVEAGKRAAKYMTKYLQGEELPTEWKEEPPIGTNWAVISEDEPAMERMKIPTLPVEQRLSGFQEVNLSVDEEAAHNEASRCLDCGSCCECFQCVEACKAGAVNHAMGEKRITLDVGSVVLSPGYETFHAELKGEYGYGRIKNVITSMEFERILSASGPFQGKILRPSDNEHPRKIAWIQCVGSRDTTCSREYCSSVCCMYATKQALIASEHYKDMEATVFYNDIRAFGKGFEPYYESAKNNFGVRYVKGIVSTVKELQKNKNMMLRYAQENGSIQEDEFDLVVLSVGLQVPDKIKELARKLDVEVDTYGFCETKDFYPNETSRQGIYVAGVFENPMDIPESVMGASSAASLSASLLSEARGSLTRSAEFPEERDTSAEDPKIGVFVCHCGVNIARVVNVPEVVELAKGLPFVEYAEDNLYTCSSDATRRISEIIKEKGLNRIVVSSCSPRTHEPLFRDTLREAGVNPYLFEMANIRDQCSWVHSDEPEKATEKAKDLVRMAVARAATLESIYETPFPVVQKALVLGGGVSGMTAALQFAEQGHETYLVEKEEELGGNARRLQYTLGGGKPAEFVEQLIQRVENEGLIHVMKEAEILETKGHVGHFNTKVFLDGKQQEIEHGVIIIATGAREYQPKEYLYGKNERILTQLELEERIARQDKEVKDAKSIVMIQCVGSRDEEHPFCSRVCCSEAVKNALKLKESNPDVDIYVLYRDIRTYSLNELYYKEARKKGVIFVRYEPEHRPEVTGDENQLNVHVVDQAIGIPLEIHPDFVVLSTGIHPQEDAERLSATMKLPLNMDGFFLEAHMKLRPLDFSNDGCYLCGLAHAPKLIDESIAQAKGAAARAGRVLSRTELSVSGMISVVDDDRCVACLTCVRACPFGVPVIGNEGVAEIDAALCQGCGICASVCPRKAIALYHFKDEQVLPKVMSLY